MGFMSYTEQHRRNSEQCGIKKSKAKMNHGATMRFCTVKPLLQAFFPRQSNHKANLDIWILQSRVTWQTLIVRAGAGSSLKIAAWAFTVKLPTAHDGFSLHEGWYVLESNECQPECSLRPRLLEGYYLVSALRPGFGKSNGCDEGTCQRKPQKCFQAICCLATCLHCSAKQEPCSPAREVYPHPS